MTMYIAKTLSFYKRKEIREEMVSQADHKEIAMRFGERGFGRRPDVLKFPQDVLELAQRGASSFHCSEELWSNPMSVKTGMRKNELDNLRIGWDLILDIDCPVWEFSKLITHLFIRALQDYGITSITCKFSGNKGFHIAVPWEAFPEATADKQTKDLFPDAPKRIAQYLLEFISKSYIKVLSSNAILFGKKEYTLKQLREHFSKDTSDFLVTKCRKCNMRIKGSGTKKYEFHCLKGHFSTRSSEEELICPKCNAFMERYELSEPSCSCGEKADKVTMFDPLSIVEVDTILIAPRHLYRMPYSLHEKSWLVSIPVDPSKVLNFEKESARLENVRLGVPFLDRKNVKEGEASRLLVAAYDFFPQIEEEDPRIKREFEIPDEAIPESCFPPCILKGLEGLEDGRKRFLFILTNFLYCCGWGPNEVEEKVNSWNQNNRVPLKDTIVVSHLKHARAVKKKILPPNCNADGYYRDIGLCDPNCKAKNPVQFAKRCFNSGKRGRKPKKAKKLEKTKNAVKTKTSPK